MMLEVIVVGYCDRNRERHWRCRGRLDVGHGTPQSNLRAAAPVVIVYISCNLVANPLPAFVGFVHLAALAVLCSLQRAHYSFGSTSRRLAAKPSSPEQSYCFQSLVLLRLILMKPLQTKTSQRRSASCYLSKTKPWRLLTVFVQVLVSKLPSFFDELFSFDIISMTHRADELHVS